MAKNNDSIPSAENLPEKGYLTLKEASELSEYSPDYIGQLIRAGKIEGKQVYSNVAWVTTEKSLRSYMKNKGKESSLLTAVEEADEVVPDFFRPLLYTVIVCGAFFLLILIHVFSVTLDKAISSSYAKSPSTEAQNI